MCIRVGVEINFNVFRGSGVDSGNTLAVRGVSPGAVYKLAKSLKIKPGSESWGTSVPASGGFQRRKKSTSSTIDGTAHLT